MQDRRPLDRDDESEGGRNEAVRILQQYLAGRPPARITVTVTTRETFTVDFPGTTAGEPSPN